MAQGISLHIGLNSVDPAHYQGWSGHLAACEFDAKDMLALAKTQGFTSSPMLLTKAATVAAVKTAMTDAAKKLVSGDIFFLTYSGHGGQVPDGNNDEIDRKDETWVLYDRMLVDDELFGLYSLFKTGVRVLVLSDSCHSGTVTRAVPPFIDGSPAPRVLPTAIGSKVYKANKAMYDNVQAQNKAAELIKVKASVLLISGCQDNQVSLDGARNGLFTGTMKKVWNSGKFVGSSHKFRDVIVTKMPATQTPNYYIVGASSLAFEAQKPFTI